MGDPDVLLRFRTYEEFWLFCFGQCRDFKLGCATQCEIRKRLARKRCLNSKRVYEYERISLHIPKEFHEAIKPYLDEDLDLKVTAEKGSLTIILTPARTLRHAANDPAKTQQKTSEQPTST